MTLPPRIDRRAMIVHAAAIALVTLVTYAGSLDGTFVSDDLARVRDNPSIAALTLGNIRAIFTTFDDANYIPFKVLSLAIDRQLWGPTPTGYHITNLILHVGCALLVYLILLRLEFTSLVACLAAALWAVHPLQVESVAWISERKNVLSGLFFFAAFRLYLDYAERPRRGTYAAFVTLYLLALLSKMNTMVLPAICLAYEATFRGPPGRRAWLATALPAALAVAVGWYNLAGNPIHGQGWHGGSPVVTWLSSAVVLWRYLRRIIVPVGLEPLYDIELYGSPLDLPVAASLLGIVVLVGATLWLLRRRPRAAFWLLWFAICLSPMSNIAVPFRSMMNDRYMYLPLLGPVALAAYALSGVSAPTVRRAAMALAGIAMVACVSVSIRQVEVWSDTITLWGASAVRRPVTGGDPVYNRPDYAERVAYLERALVAYPSSAAVHNNLGALYYEKGRLEDALRELETANRLTPDEPMILLNLGRIYTTFRRMDEADAALARATELRPYEFVNYLYRARLHLFGDHDAAKARAALDAGLRVEPDAERGILRELDQLSRLEGARSSSDSSR